MRVFAAAVPPREIRNRFSVFASRFDRCAHTTKVSPVQMHLTLAFFAHLEPKEVQAVTAVLQETPFPQIHLSMDKISTFSKNGAPSVLYVDGHSDELISFTDQLRTKLSAQKIPFDPKPFKPHMTLARIRTVHDTNEWDRNFRLICEEFQPATLILDRITLFKSTLTPTGPRYGVLHEHILTPSEK